MRIQEFLNECLPLRARGNSRNFADNSRSSRRIPANFLRVGVGCSNSNKSFHFGADPDYDPGPGTFNGIFTTAG